ncbi:MAG: hypothetical protein IKT46_07270 [Clostridia bacterium]|nr:hypothetical protein [Clostridia bacterium]
MKKILLLLLTFTLALYISLPLFAATETGSAVYVPDDLAGLAYASDETGEVVEDETVADDEAVAVEETAEIEEAADASDETEVAVNYYNGTTSSIPTGQGTDAVNEIINEAVNESIIQKIFNSSWFINILTILTVMVIILAPSLMIVALVVVLIIAKKNLNNKPEQTENE